ncbi:MAG: FtsX-like permease family protein [Bacteroidales bacterium]|nr:FtsX-like permease family protein [Bacteroidales bacterium]
MIKYYLLPFFKRSLKNRAQVLVLISSITIFFTLFLVGYYYVNYEYSYDKFHVDNDQIYRIIIEENAGEQTVFCPLPLALTAAKEIPGVSSYIRLNDSQYNIFKYKEHKIKSEQGYMVDSSFFDFFSFQLIEGNIEAINNPNSIFLSKDFAQRLTGSNNPIGEVITFDYGGFKTLTIEGLFEVPVNSHLQFDWIYPNTELIKRPIFSWDSYGIFYSYLKIQPNSDVEEIERKILAIAKENIDGGFLEKIHLQALKQIYLKTDDKAKAHDVSKYGSKKLISLLLLISVLIVVLLWTNLLNIISVTISNRAKEFSLRKACGAYNHQLIQQTFIETLLIVFISGLLSLPLVNLVTDLALRNLELVININILTLRFWVIFLIILVLNSFVLGLFNIIALKGVPDDRVSSYQRQSNIFDVFKRGFVMLQLAITIFIIIFMLIIDKQINFMLNKDLGIDIDDIVLIQDPTVGKLDEGIVSKGKVFKNEIVNNPNIQSVSSSTFPGRRFYGSADMNFRGKEMNLTVGHIDPNFISTYRVKLLAGQNLSYTNKPWTSVLINRKLAKKIGFNNPEDALHNTLVTEYGNRGNIEIVGVIEDYNHLSINNPIEPLVFALWPYSPNEYYSVRVKEKKTETISFIKGKFVEIFGEDNLFDYMYLNDYFNRQYSGVLKFRTIISYLMILIIFLCCVGIYGFFSVELNKKVKSIAIRRCLGGRSYNILYTLIENYYLFILIASVITIPISYFLIKEWLNNFSNVTSLSWLEFILPVFYVMLIIFITILNKLLSALRLNTIEALKNE